MLKVSVGNYDSGVGSRILKEAKHSNLLLHVVVTLLVLRRKLHFDVVEFKNFVVDAAPF